ncbi:2-oxoglutarate and iron-dependent oxygenase domain-containing protein [Mariniluteicoccus endophyticus]
MDQLPIIDLSLADNPATAPRLRDDLLRAAHEIGFFYLVGHGLDQARQDEVVRVAREFFALPDDEKRRIENLRTPHFRGWARIGGERTQGRTDWREQVDIAVEREPVTITDTTPDWAVLEGPNQWPERPAEFRPVFERWHRDLSAVGHRLLQEWSQALGQPRDFFDAAYADQLSLIKVVRYPGREGDDQGVGAHKDSGLLTLLLVEQGKAGLQVEGPDGRWIDAPHVDGAFIVNIGELLESATDGYLIATNHRVVSPPPWDDRISVPFFYNPGLDAVIPRLQLPPELAARSRGVTQDESNAIFDTYGANALKSRLRSHPDVAEIHHQRLLARA